MRTSGFLRRELVGMFRQPRLIVTLIIAPFAILLVFGLGYRTEPPPSRTLLVLPSDDASLATGDVDLDDAFGHSIDLVGTTSDVTDARCRLRTGDVDLLIIAPADAIASLEQGKKAVFVVVHSKVDPAVRSSVELLAQLSVNELNRLVVTDVIGEAQAESEVVEEHLQALHEGTASLIRALDTGDSAAAARSRDDISEDISLLEAGAGAANMLFARVSNQLGTADTDPFERLRSGLTATEGDDGLAAAREFEASLTEFEDSFELIRGTDPDLLVRPFTVEVEDIADLPGSPALFYTPAALVILVQHLAVTFAALSLVRERQLGLTELFRVSPLKPVEILIGKLVAFLAVAGIVAAVLSGTMLAFGVTMRGSPWFYATTLFLVIVASLGLGFVLSAVARTDSQAVQYTMMVLLVSIFFSGFILPLDQLGDAVKVVSFLIPGTYGIASLHTVMFRGLPPSVFIIGGLGLYCVVALVASWFVMRRHVLAASAS